jgi:uncharacterized protein YndB with AHSA1/START domain
MSESTLVLHRHFDTDPETLFEAWTDPSVMALWLFVGPDWRAEVENDLRVGGIYRVKMFTTDGEVHTMSGEYIEIDPPRRLSFTWSSHVAADTVVTIDLSPADGGTEMTLTHSGLADATIKPHSHGWTGCLESLGRHLTSSR